MKKLLFITLLFTVACVSSSYQDNDKDKQLAKNLKGTWEGSIYLNDEEIPVDYQFFETDGTKGNFIEIAYLHEYDGDFDIRYFDFVSGEFSVENGQLLLTFLPETSTAEPFDEAVLMDYAAALMDYYQEEGKEILWDSVNELADSVLEMLEEEWGSVCEERNNTSGLFSNLTVTEGKMSFVDGERTLEFKKGEQDWFTAYPFAE
ncbi:MAG: hypothetical protein K5920_03150 [Bacteroidales bacterium]|nr:hypothetical protein [Bacteroidales bacterium]